MCTAVRTAPARKPCAVGTARHRCPLAPPVESPELGRKSAHVHCSGAVDAPTSVQPCTVVRCTASQHMACGLELRVQCVHMSCCALLVARPWRCHSIHADLLARPDIGGGRVLPQVSNIITRALRRMMVASTCVCPGSTTDGHCGRKATWVHSCCTDAGRKGRPT